MKSILFFSSANVLYGPLHTKQAVSMFLGAVEEAKKEGGTVVYGGKVRTTWDQDFVFLLRTSRLWVNWWNVPDCWLSFLHSFCNRGVSTYLKEWQCNMHGTFLKRHNSEPRLSLNWVPGNLYGRKMKTSFSWYRGRLYSVQFKSAFSRDF